LSRVTTRFGLVAAAAALMLTLGLATAGTAQAQVLPAVLYGQGLDEGDEVSAYIGGELCETATVNADGEWTMQIPPDADCDPSAGDSVTFTLNGDPATSSPPATWASGGTPSDVANGYTLTVSQATATPTATATATATRTATATTTATATATTTSTPVAPKTGNAGLLGEDGGNGGLWLLLGFAAVAGAAVAGRQLYSRR
jgi:hypothetical protein